MQLYRKPDNKALITITHCTRETCKTRCDVTPKGPVWTTRAHPANYRMRWALMSCTSDLGRWQGPAVIIEQYRQHMLNLIAALKVLWCQIIFKLMWAGRGVRGRAEQAGWQVDTPNRSRNAWLCYSFEKTKPWPCDRDSSLLHNHNISQYRVCQPCQWK